MKQRERWLLPVGLALTALFALPGLTDPLAAKWLLLSAWALLAAGFAIFRQPVAPQMNKLEWIALAGIGIFLGFRLYFTPSDFSLLSRFGFFALAWSAWRGFSSSLRWEDFRWPVSALVLLLSLFSFSPWAGAVLGPPELTAEILGGALVLMWGLAPVKKKAVAAAEALVSGLGLACLLHLDASVFFALLLSGAVLFARERSKRRWALLALSAVTGGLLLLLPGLRLSSPEFGEKIMGWKSAWPMLKAFPLGLGPDRFPFEFLPFFKNAGAEGLLPLSPHNDYLRLWIEYGGALFVLFFAAFFYLLVRWARKKGSRPLELALLSFIGLEMLFHAYWQNPFGLGLGAILVGALAAAVWKRRMIPAYAGPKAVLGVALFFFLFCFGKTVLSGVFERSSSPFFARLACRAEPANWRACLNYGKVLFAGGETTEARRVVETELEREPWNFVAIRYLGVIALKQNDRLEACFLTWKYDDLFSGRSSVHEEYEKNCPARWRDYFQRKRPKKYYRR